jgi:hypothetical protein
MKTDEELLDLFRGTADTMANDVRDDFKSYFRDDPSLTPDEYTRLYHLAHKTECEVIVHPLTYTDDWDDDNIWPTCVEWCRIHDVEPRLLAGILEFQGEAAWFPPNDNPWPVNYHTIFMFCTMNYANYRLHNPESEDHLLYGMNDDEGHERDYPITD